MAIIDAHAHLVQCIAGTGRGDLAPAAAEKPSMPLDRSFR